MELSIGIKENMLLRNEYLHTTYFDLKAMLLLGKCHLYQEIDVLALKTKHCNNSYLYMFLIIYTYTSELLGFVE